MNAPFSRRLFTKTEKQRRHKVFSVLLALLEGKQIKYRSKVLPYILHPLTIEGLLRSGFKKADIEGIEASIFKDAEYMRDCEVLRYVPRHPLRELEKLGDVNVIFENRIVEIPNSITNALICEELVKRFTESELNLCGCFYKIRDFDDNRNLCVVWRIDIDERLSNRGFIVPRFENGLIADLRVFRYLKDERPFILRSRIELIDRTEESYE